MGKGLTIVAFIFAIAALLCACLCSLLWVLAVIGLPVSLAAVIISAVATKRVRSKLGTAAFVLSFLALVICTVTFFTCGICYILGSTAY